MRIMVAILAISRKHAAFPGRELRRLGSDRSAIKFSIAKQESADEIIVGPHGNLNSIIITTYAIGHVTGLRCKDVKHSCDSKL